MGGRDYNCAYNYDYSSNHNNDYTYDYNYDCLNAGGAAPPRARLKSKSSSGSHHSDVVA